MASGNSYNGYTWSERMRKYTVMKERIAQGKLAAPSGPCDLCGDTEVPVDYHDEDYSVPYRWSRPAAYVLCKHCHIHKVHARFANPLRWLAFLDHVRRGGHASDLKLPEVKKEFEAHCAAVKAGKPSNLKPLGPYRRVHGSEWFASLTMDPASLESPAARPRP